MQSSIMSNVPEGFYIFEKGFNMLEKCVYIFEKIYIYTQLLQKNVHDILPCPVLPLALILTLT